jgi:hypothetical protein
MSRGSRRIHFLQSPAFALAALALILASSGGCIADPDGPAPGDTWAQEALWTRTPPADRILALRQELLALGPEVTPEDAGELAGAAVRYAERLAADYGMDRPIEVHNVMVNLGLRKGGLCYQLADDLFVRLRAMNLGSFDLYRGIARKGDIWLEHNSVVVTAPGQPFETGVVLDPWRYAGKLRFLRVADDHQPWQVRPVAGSTQPFRATPITASAGMPPATAPAAAR